MANPLRGEAAIAGVDKTLVFDMNAFCQAEAALGEKLPTIIDSLKEGVGFSTIRTLVWAGLQRKHPCTVNDAGDVISDAGLDAVTEAMTIAMTAALPQDAKGPNPPKAATTKATG